MQNDASSLFIVVFRVMRIYLRICPTLGFVTIVFSPQEKRHQTSKSFCCDQRFLFFEQWLHERARLKNKSIDLFIRNGIFFSFSLNVMEEKGNK